MCTGPSLRRSRVRNVYTVAREPCRVSVTPANIFEMAVPFTFPEGIVCYFYGALRLFSVATDRVTM